MVYLIRGERLGNSSFPILPAFLFVRIERKYVRTKGGLYESSFINKYIVGCRYDNDNQMIQGRMHQDRGSAGIGGADRPAFRRAGLSGVIMHRRWWKWFPSSRTASCIPRMRFYPHPSRISCSTTSDESACPHSPSSCCR